VVDCNINSAAPPATNAAITDSTMPTCVRFASLSGTSAMRTATPAATSHGMASSTYERRGRAGGCFTMGDQCRPAAREIAAATCESDRENVGSRTRALDGDAPTCDSPTMRCGESSVGRPTGAHATDDSARGRRIPARPSAWCLLQLRLGLAVRGVRLEICLPILQVIREDVLHLAKRIDLMKLRAQLRRAR
jgi:hypothetical protein